jgi:hypothetical protein
MSEIIARVDRGRIHVSSPYEALELCQSIAGRLFDRTTKTSNYPASATTAEAIFRTFTDADYAVRCDRAFVELCAKASDQISARAMKKRTDLPDIPGKVKPAWLHQRQAFHFARELDGALLGVGMGGGKTKTAIALVEDVKAARILIACPKNVVDVWPKEFAKHAEASWKVTTGAAISTRTGKPKKTTSIADRTEKIALDLDVFAANPCDGIGVVVN